ncbi:hypothetical protein BDV35DRAFT_392000 [Aspergillus flavus]|uniref:Uncharacterized protein n=1 Tax=Aspergillus flavus TaxID=5059 RepID=A0A5N6H2L0_ASPFL|nr:hypothetical protein BDV35DRAFT_392000 [Aspergillus flavus]GMF76846.1 unnamed protein product [Aspergillus oryzae]GMF90778.1 unnamed protein product [Aspergillus oryzae]
MRGFGGNQRDFGAGDNGMNGFSGERQEGVDEMDVDEMDVDEMDVDEMDMDEMDMDEMDVDEMDVDESNAGRDRGAWEESEDIQRGVTEGGQMSTSHRDIQCRRMELIREREYHYHKLADIQNRLEGLENGARMEDPRIDCDGDTEMIDRKIDYDGDTEMTD